MLDFKCKCGNTEQFHTLVRGSQIGVYCSKCNFWIKWLPKNEIGEFNQKYGIEIKPKLTFRELQIKCRKLVDEMHTLKNEAFDLLLNNRSTTEIVERYKKIQNELNQLTNMEVK